MGVDIFFKGIIILNILFGIFLYWQGRQMKRKDIDNDIAHKLQFLTDENKTVWNRIDEGRKKTDDILSRLVAIETQMKIICKKVLNGND